MSVYLGFLEEGSSPQDVLRKGGMLASLALYHTKRLTFYASIPTEGVGWKYCGAQHVMRIMVF